VIRTPAQRSNALLPPAAFARFARESLLHETRPCSPRRAPPLCSGADGRALLLGAAQPDAERLRLQVRARARAWPATTAARAAGRERI
jgi:hypothetical protein